MTLQRFRDGVFDPIVGVDDVENPKPHPEGLIKIRSTVPHTNIWYVGDTIDDATVRWPEMRIQVVFGDISLNEVAPNNASEQQHVIFDPIPRVDGIEASADPLFEPRANVYLMSGRRRRAAGEH